LTGVNRLSASSADQSDEELLVDFRRGGEGGAALFERYREPVWKFFRRRLVDAGKAEELAQDVFASLFEASHRYEPRGRFRSYLFAIAYNVLMAERRKGRLATPFDVDPDLTPIASADPGEALWVQRALADLDELDREVVMLREYEGLTYEEISLLHDVPVNTVRSRLFRARMALRDALMPQPVQKEGAR
jgi:RNA polymerase sigma-70 factor (ECF subfamily)